MLWTEPRLDELGLSRVGCDPNDEVAHYRKIPDAEKKSSIKDAWLIKSLYLHDSCNASLCFLVNGDHPNARHWAASALESAETYFFGEWRDLAPSGDSSKEPPSREYQDIHCTWWNDYGPMMAIATALGRWTEFERFATYLHDDVRLNVDQTEAHRAWWLYFCGIVRKRPAKEIAHFRQAVIDAKRAKTDQLLLAWVDALVDGTDEQLSDAMTAYFQHHRKVEAKKPGLRLAIRGSMLLHYGAHLGRTVERPPNSDLYIVEFAE